ncbi:MAG: ATP-binding cassette domain-containing protein [Microthrixaceae bacterium]
MSFTYPDQESPSLRDVDLTVDEGEWCLVAGRTGSGKSTLLRAVNGLVPRFSGGVLRGSVTVAGRSTSEVKPRDLAETVGFVGQDPAAGFVTETVEEELAYAPEQLGLAPTVMRTRVEEILDLLGLDGLRDRPLRSLSGGQQQRVAIGSVLTAHPRVLVLDEPTSALDPTAAEDVLGAVARLVHDIGVTVLIAEHRIERVVHFADTVLELRDDGTAGKGAPGDVLAGLAVAPPIVVLAEALQWVPPPLSVRAARRRLAADPRRGVIDRVGGDDRAHAAEPDARPVVATLDSVSVRRGDVGAVHDVSLRVHRGEIVALMGRNGSGKSSLLWAVQGSLPRVTGTVRVADGTDRESRATTSTVSSAHGDVRWWGRLLGGRPAAGRVGSVEGQAGHGACTWGVDPAALPAPAARHLVGMVPQTPSDLLYHETVGEELDTAGGGDAGAAARARSLLASLLSVTIPDRSHPRDLSEGQRLALVLALQLSAEPALLLLDEPTRGLDVPGKADLARWCRSEGRAAIIATHDVEFVADVADRVVVLSHGELIADGPVREVLGSTPMLSTQVAKVTAPTGLLTVREVCDALAALIGTR